MAVSPLDASKEQADEDVRWKLATSINVTGWKGGVQVSAATAPVIAVQEHKLSKQRLAEESAKLKKTGRHMLGSPCIHGPNGGDSAGVALVFKKHVDAWNPEQHGLHPGRLVCAYSRIPRIGVSAWYSVYLKDGIGLADENLDVLEK